MTKLSHCDFDCAASGQSFSHPAISPANFTEGATSQAVCSPKAKVAGWGSIGVFEIAEVISPKEVFDLRDTNKTPYGEVDSPAVKVKRRKKTKKARKVLTKNDMDDEPEFSSGTESSEDGLTRKVLNLPSSSSTTISTEDVRGVEKNVGDDEVMKSQKLAPMVAAVPMDEGFNCELEVSVSVDVGEDMESGELIVGEGKGNDEGHVRDGIGLDQENVLEDKTSDEGDVGHVKNSEEEGCGQQKSELDGDVVKGLIIDVQVAREVAVRERHLAGSEGKKEELVELEEEQKKPTVVASIAGTEEKKEELMEVAVQAGLEEELKKSAAVATEAGIEEEKEKPQILSPEAAAVKNAKTKKSKKKEGKRNQKDLHDEGETQTFVENLYSPENSSYAESSKIAAGVAGGIHCGDEVVALITDPNPTPKPPRRRSARSQHVNLSLSTQVDKASSKKRGRS